MLYSTKKNLFILSLILFPLVILKAQPNIDLTFRIGGNVSFFKASSNLSGAVTAPLNEYYNFEGGFGLKWNFSKSFSLEPALNLIRKSFISKASSFNNGQRDSYTFYSYLEIPLLIRFQTSGKTKFYVDAGPYVNFLLSAKSRQDLGANRGGVVTSDIKSVTNSNQFGVITGFGVMFGRFGLDFRYNYGFSNVVQYFDIFKLKSQNVSFSLIYWLPIKKKKTD